MCILHDMSIDLIGFDNTKVDQSKSALEKVEFESIIHDLRKENEKLKLQNLPLPSTSTNYQLESEIKRLRKEKEELQLIHSNEIRQIEQRFAKESVNIVEKKLAELAKNNATINSPQPGKRKRGEESSEMESNNELVKYFESEFSKLTNSIGTLADKIDAMDKRMKVIEAGSAANRGRSPGNVSLNDSISSPRGPQAVTINMPPSNTRPMNRQQSKSSKFQQLSYAQALAASTIPIGAILNIRILGEDDDTANATAMRIKKDKRFVNSGIREITQKSRFNLTIKCKNEDDAATIRRELNTTYGNLIEIANPKETKPMIKITNIIDDIEDAATIESTIRRSNYWATELNFAVTD